MNCTRFVRSTQSAMINSMIRKFLRTLRQLKFSYTPLVEITISKERLLHNLSVFKKECIGAAIAPVLKSNAYGHGLIQVAKILDEQEKNERSPFLVIDSYYEALILRNEKIISPLLIIGFTNDENIYHSPLKNLSFTLIGIEQLTDISANLTLPTHFHLKIDTGMSRHGIRPEDFTKAVECIKNNKNILLEGICSHFADADGDDSAFTKMQIQAWHEAVKFFTTAFPSLTYFHISATSGATYHRDIKANMLRLGLGLYGILPDSKDNRISSKLLPVLEMKSVISTVKHIKKGDSVGYNHTFTAPQDMTIATIPAGYFEGIDRRLSNIGFVTIGNIPCPLIGRISMNISTIDISKLKEAKRGDEVTIISSNPLENNSAAKMAVLAKTVPWEILVHIPAQLRRTVIK